MAYQGIGTGTTPNDNTGDSLLEGAVKINSNFKEIYNALGDGNTINNNLWSGFRNIAINGNFDIWQRGTTRTANVEEENAFRLADRWVTGIDAPKSYSPSGTFTTSREVCTSNELSNFNASFYQRITHNNINYGTDINTLVNNIATSLLAYQNIENAVSLFGKTVTLSFWARASAPTKILSETQIHNLDLNIWTPTICKTFNLTTTWQKFTHTYTIPTYSQIVGAAYNRDSVDVTLTNPTYIPIGETSFPPPSELLCQIDLKTSWSLSEWRRSGNAYLGSRPSGFEGTEQTLEEMIEMNNSFITNGYYDIAQIQLELGHNATSFENRPIGTELALCQRYYYKSNIELDGSIYAPLIIGETDAYCFHVPFPVTMRTSPTEVRDSLWKIGISAGSGTQDINAIRLFYPTGAWYGVRGGIGTGERMLALRQGEPSPAYDAEI